MTKIKEFSEELVEEILSAKDDYRKSKAVEMLSTYIAEGIGEDLENIENKHLGQVILNRQIDSTNRLRQEIRTNFGLETT